MLRFYLDSNIFRYLKGDKLSYNKDLHTTLKKLVDKKVFMYSDAHLDDLKDSPKEYAEQDLLHMEEYVKDNFFHRDPIKNITECILKKPIEAFGEIDFSSMDNVMSNFNLEDVLFKDYDDSEESQQLKNLINSVFDLVQPWSIN